MDKLKYTLAGLGGVICTYFKQYYILYIFVAIAVLLDFLTGMSAAVIEGEGLSSQKAGKGLLKKMILLLSVSFGTFLDVLLPFCARYTGISIHNTLLFSTVICVYVCITECISIVENIYRCTGGAVPHWIMKLLKEAKNNMENTEE